MSATIKTIYLPNIDDMCDIEFISNVFNKCGIAKVRSIAIEPQIIKSTHPNIATRKYNRAYIEIHSWHDTETARKFAKQLRDYRVETRLQYSNDNWWVVKVNQFPNKLKSSSKRLFKECVLSYRSALASTPTSVSHIIPAGSESGSNAGSESESDAGSESASSTSNSNSDSNIYHKCTDTDADMRSYLKEMHDAICEYSELCRLEDLKRLQHTLLLPPSPWHVIYNYE